MKDQYSVDNTQAQLEKILKQDPIEYRGKRCHYPHPSWYKGQSEALTNLIDEARVEELDWMHSRSVRSDQVVIEKRIAELKSQKQGREDG